MNGTIDPPGVQTLTNDEVAKLGNNLKLREGVREVFLRVLSRRIGAHTASARQARKQRRKDEQLERQIKLREQTSATVISVPSADGSLPPGHKCAHGVYIPTNSHDQERTRYCSICHPYIILRYSKLRPIILRHSKFLWWSPNAATVENISDSRPPFKAPHWTGEPCPHGARRVPLRSKFPALPYLTYLVSELGYDGNAAFAAMVQAHQTWLRSVDRRRANPVGADAPAWTKAHGYSTHVSMHPYCPVAPGRRTKTGGGWTKQQVQHALNKRRWDSKMKKAVFEIVYRRRMTQEVSDESGLPVGTLYVYASRLRQDMLKTVKDLSKVENKVPTLEGLPESTDDRALNKWEEWYQRDCAEERWTLADAFPYHTTPDYRGWLEMLWQNEEMTEAEYLAESQRLREQETYKEPEDDADLYGDESVI